MSQVERVLVVGGGIGGLSATIALRRGRYEVDVVEQNPAWDVYGVGIIQPGNALRALNELDLAQEAVAEGQPMYGDTTWTGDGRALSPTTTGRRWSRDFPGQRHHSPAAAPDPADPHVDSGADIRTGVTFTSMTDTGKRVEVEFTDGEPRTYDLVVGADGLGSQVRTTIFGREYKARYTVRCAGATTCPGSRGSTRSGCTSAKPAPPASARCRRI